MMYARESTFSVQKEAEKRLFCKKMQKKYVFDATF